MAYRDISTRDVNFFTRLVRNIPVPGQFLLLKEYSGGIINPSDSVSTPTLEYITSPTKPELDISHVIAAPYEDETAASTDMVGRRRSIALAFTLLTLPLLVLASMLLYLVYHNRLDHSGAEEEQCPSRLLVDFEAAQLALVVSWMSSIAGQLLSPAMLLLSYPIARQLINVSKTDSSEGLPTVFETSILINSLGADIYSVVETLRHSFSSRKAGKAKPQRTIYICFGFLAILLVLG